MNDLLKLIHFALQYGKKERTRHKIQTMQLLHCSIKNVTKYRSFSYSLSCRVLQLCRYGIAIQEVKKQQKGLHF